MGRSPSSCWILARAESPLTANWRRGVQRLADVRIGGVGDKGDAKGYAAYAGSIRIGSLEFRNCPVDVIDKRSVTDEEGLIGADVFQRFLIEIDFPGRKLRLSQLPERPGEPQVKPSLTTDEDDSGSESDPNPPARRSRRCRFRAGPQAF